MYFGMIIMRRLSCIWDIFIYAFFLYGTDITFLQLAVCCVSSDYGTKTKL